MLLQWIVSCKICWELTTIEKDTEILPCPSKIIMVLQKHQVGVGLVVGVVVGTTVGVGVGLVGVGVGLAGTVKYP
jgi:hypothetical protein